MKLKPHHQRIIAILKLSPERRWTLPDLQDHLEINLKMPSGSRYKLHTIISAMIDLVDLGYLVKIPGMRRRAKHLYKLSMNPISTELTTSRKETGNGSRPRSAESLP
jgi:hypothetical protein